MMGQFQFPIMDRNWELITEYRFARTEITIASNVVGSDTVFSKYYTHVTRGEGCISEVKFIKL